MKSKKKFSKPELILDLRPPIKSKNKLNISNIKIIMILIGAIVLIVISFIFLRPTHKQIGQQDLNTAKQKVGQLMILPNDEDPTLAAVTDKNAVKDPFIAKKADNGDQILIYAKNKIVIIYRPKANKIVAVGNVFADPALSEADGATLTVLNGINNSDKVKQIITKLSALYPKLNVIDGGNTIKQDFPATLVIDNSNKKDELVDALAHDINGRRGIVPVSETPSGTDLMIIVGKD